MSKHLIVVTQFYSPNTSNFTTTRMLFPYIRGMCFSRWEDIWFVEKAWFQWTKQMLWIQGFFFNLKRRSPIKMANGGWLKIFVLSIIVADVLWLWSNIFLFFCYICGWLTTSSMFALNLYGVVYLWYHYCCLGECNIMIFLGI